MTAEGSATVQAGAPRSFVSKTDPVVGRGYTLRVVSLSLDVALDTAVEAAERVPTFSLRADWNGNGNYNHRFSDLSPMVKSFTLTQELATDLPPVIGYVEGTAASKLTFVLGGRFLANNIIRPDGTYVEDTETIKAFSPYGVSGPGALINRKLELRTGFQTPEGPVNLLRFTGTLTAYSPAASTREVTMDALDPVSRLRRPLTQYAFGIDGELLSRVGNFSYPWAINVQWMIDRILRLNGYYASPPPGGIAEGAVVLSATMHGSHQHEIGSFSYVIIDYYPGATGALTPYEYGVSADPKAPEAHPFQMMFPRQGYDYIVKWLGRSPAPMRVGIDGWGMSGWVRLPAAGSTLSGEVWSLQPADRGGPIFALQLRVYSGVPVAFVIYPDLAQSAFTLPGFTLSAQPKWAFIGVHFSPEAAGIRMTMKFDDQYGQAFSGRPVPSDLVYENSVLIYGRTIVPFTNFSVWYQAVAPGPLEWKGQTWTPTAYVDPAVNWIGGIPDLLNRESYDLLKEIVAAELGSFMFDETGKPIFKSRIVNRGWNRPPELLTSERNLSDLVVTVDDSAIRNSIDYESSTWAVGPWGPAWEPDDPYYFTLGANQFNTWILPIPENIAVIAETDDYITKWVSSELWSEAKDNPFYAGKLIFCASLLSDPTVDVYSAVLAGKLSTAKLVFRVRRIDSLKVEVRVTSFCPYGIRLATASKIGTNSATGSRDNGMVTEGEPAFRLPGRELIEYPAETYSLRDERSILVYGLQSYDLGGKNLWRQTPGSGSYLGSSVLRYTGKPKPILSEVEVPHNPRRKLYDKVILTEPDSFGARIWCTVHGISTTYDESGARDTLTLRADESPPGW